MQVGVTLAILKSNMMNCMNRHQAVFKTIVSSFLYNFIYIHIHTYVSGYVSNHGMYVCNLLVFCIMLRLAFMFCNYNIKFTKVATFSSIDCHAKPKTCSKSLFDAYNSQVTTKIFILNVLVPCILL